MADSELAVDHRWIVENYILVTAGRAVAINQFEGCARESFG